MKKVGNKVLFLILIVAVIFLIPKQVKAANRVIDANNTGNFNKTKVEIQSKWQSSNLSVPANYSIFSVEPIYEGPNYRAGVVKQEYLDKVLANLNYYRYLMGSPIITTKMKNREDLQTGEVCQYISIVKQGNGLTHWLEDCFKKPNDMSQSFYDLGVNASHNIISSYGYGAPVFPFFSESNFEYTAGHRTALLSPRITKVEFGLGKVTYGDTSSTGFSYNNMQGIIAAYPSPGYFPKQDFASESDWDIYLNMNNFSSLTDAEIKNVEVTIKSTKLNKTYTYRVNDKNLEVQDSLILIKQPEKDYYYDGDYEVYVKNLKDKSGNLVDLKYTVKFFDKFEGTASNIKDIKYENDFSDINMDAEFNKNVVKEILPKNMTLILESGGVVDAKITDYEIDEKGQNTYWYQTHKIVPKATLPSYVKDGNKKLEKGIINYVNTDADDYEFKYTTDSFTGEENGEVTISATFTGVYKDFSNYNWYKEKNNVVEKIQSNSKYKVNGEKLTIKNLTKDDEAKYYLVNTTNIYYLVGDPVYISKGLKLTVKATPKVLYRTHVQEEGWQTWKKNGEMAGTLGKSYRLEGIEMKLESLGVSGDIQYRTHIQNLGWEQNFKKNGEMSGTSGKSLRLEAIQIKLTGEAANKYDIYYRVHAQEFGWMGWAKNGEEAGTSGYGYRLEGIEIRLVAKGGKTPGTTENAFRKSPPSVVYATQVQNTGWQDEVKNGVTSGTLGKSLRLEGIRISLNNSIGGGIEYRTHIQNIGWEEEWKANGATSGTVGKSLRLEAIQIRLTGEMAKKYDVYYRVHSQEFGWLGWAKNGESAGTAGYSYRLEGIQIRLVEKGGKAPGDTANRYKTK